MNSHAFNRVFLNARVSVNIVLAVASFTAEATVTPVESTKILAGSANISVDVQSSLNSYKTVFGNWVEEVESILVMEGLQTKVARGNWTVTSSFRAEQLLFHAGEVGFDTSTSIEFLADAKIASGAWAVSAEITAPPILTQAASGTLSTESSSWGTDATKAVVTRFVESDWVLDSTINIEATYTDVGGDVFHDGFFPASATLTWTNIQYLTFAMTVGGFSGVTGTLTPTAFVTHAAKANWAATDSSLALPANRLFERTAAWNSSAAFTLNGVIAQNGEVSLEAGVAVNTPRAVQEHAGEFSLALDTELSVTVSAHKQAGRAQLQVAAAPWYATAFRVVLSTGYWGVQVLPSFSGHILQLGDSALTGQATIAMTAKQQHQAVGAWSGSGATTLTGTALVFSESASDRAFKIDLTVSRTYVIDLTRTQLEVAA